MDAATLVSKASPSVTKLIRMDHSQVMLTSHKYRPDLPADRKRALVNAICLALEIHTQLEEEVFYPALRELAADNEVLSKARPAHDEMRHLISDLRAMSPDDAGYDERFMELMRDVIHHVADEETVLLPLAERLLKDRLGELGARMAKRRIELSKPHAAEMAGYTVRAVPGATMLMAGALLAGGYLVGRAAQQRRH